MSQTRLLHLKSCCRWGRGKYLNCRLLEKGRAERLMTSSMTFPRSGKWRFDKSLTKAAKVLPVESIDLIFHTQVLKLHDEKPNDCEADKVRQKKFQKIKNSKVKRIFLANAIEVAGAGCTALYPSIPRYKVFFSVEFGSPNQRQSLYV